jgi:hypothetical protein
MSDIDALGLEIIGLKQRLDFAERRNAYLSEVSSASGDADGD